MSELTPSPEPLPLASPPPSRLWLDPLLVVAVGLALLWPVLQTPFSPLDDFNMLRDNPVMQPPTWTGFKLQFTEPQFAIYAPLTYGLWYVIAALSYSVEHRLPVLGFKIASLLVHLGASAAAWWVLWQLVRNRAAAVLGAMIVALHPFQIESLAWTTGLKDLLCGALSFLTLGCYLRYLQAGHVKMKRWAIVLAVLATAAKPTAMVLPAMLLAIDGLTTRRPWRQRLFDVAAFVPAAVICIAIISSIQYGPKALAEDVFFRPLVAGDALAFYVWKTLWPADLSVDYARAPAMVREMGVAYWTSIVPLVIGALVLASRSSKLVLAALLFVIPVSPVLGLKPFDMQQFSTVADHYMYQSMLGVALVAAMLIAWKPLSGWVLGVVVAGLAVLSWQRLAVWKDMNALFTDAIRIAPKTVMARGCLTTLSFDRHDLLAAERYAREALAIRENTIAFDNLATALQLQNRMEESAFYARRALELPNNQIGVPRLQQMIQVAARVRDRELAKRAAIRWLELEPNNPTPTGLLRAIEMEAATQPSKNTTKP